MLYRANMKDRVFFDEHENKFNLLPHEYYLDYEKSEIKEKYKSLVDNISELNFYTAKITSENKILNLTNMPYRTNKDVRDHIQEFIDEKLVNNYALFINKYPHFENDKFHYIDSERTKLLHTFNPDIKMLEEIHNRILQVENTFKDLGYYFMTLELKLNWRLIVGLGNESVYETGMTFHPIYGIPYIPGSSIKGVLRNYFIKLNYDGIEKDAIQNSTFQQIFGYSEDENAQKGRVVFLDAFPLQDVNVEADVINPHFQNFYDSDGSIPPGDWNKTVPISFLSIKDTTFIFRFGIQSKRNI